MLAAMPEAARNSLPGATLERGVAMHRMTLEWLDATLARLPAADGTGPGS
jgi:hypothetical protein